MDSTVASIIQEEIRAIYRQKYGPVSIDFNEFRRNEDERFDIVFTISMEGSFSLDVKSI